ncbi:MAG: HEAT repeat protein [Myxococcota bacterium]|jgi:HEAT repeat protein
MQRLPVQCARVAAVSGAVVVALACGGVGAVDAVDDQAAAAIASTVTGGRLPLEIAEDPTQRPVLLHLAKRHPDPRVVAAAFRALEGAPERADELTELVIRRLDHPDGIVVAAALALAGRILSEAEAPEVADRLAQLVVEHPEPGGRHAALVALCRHREWPMDAGLASVVVGAASDPAPPVVSEALQRLAWAAEDLAVRDEVLRTALARLDHPLPAVRGNAGVVAARAAPEDGWAVASVRALLDDPHPHVRASAAVALAELGDADALPDLLALAQQRDSTRVELTGWTTLDGSDGELRFGVGLYGRTDDAAFDGLEALTASLGDERWERPEVDPEAIDASLRASARSAGEWYARHADALARLEPR